MWIVPPDVDWMLPGSQELVQMTPFIVGITPIQIPPMTVAPRTLPIKAKNKDALTEAGSPSLSLVSAVWFSLAC